MRFRILLAGTALLALLGGCGAPEPTPPPVPAPTEIQVSTVAPAPTQAQLAPSPLPTAQPAATSTLAAAPQPTSVAAVDLRGNPVPILPLPELQGTLYVQRNGEIVAVDLATREERPLGLQADMFHISPDGQWIALALDGALEIAGANGQNRQALDKDVDAFVWAPDSRALALVKGAAPEQPWECLPTEEIWVAEWPSGELRRIDSGCDPAWAPDSLRLAYVSSFKAFEEHQEPNALYLVNRYGEHRWSPYQAGDSITKQAARRYLHDPFWSADGTWVYVVGFVLPAYIETRVETLEQVDAHNGGAETTGVLVDLTSISLSPDHRYFAMGGGGETGLAAVRVMTLQGKEHACPEYEWCAGLDLQLRVEEGTRTWFVSSVAWSPDSRYLAVLYCQGGRSEWDHDRLVPS